MTKCKTKIFYCECDNPACNVTVYEYEDLILLIVRLLLFPYMHQLIIQLKMLSVMYS